MISSPPFFCGSFLPLGLDLNTIKQGFWYFTRLWSQKFQVNPSNQCKIECFQVKYAQKTGTKLTVFSRSFFNKICPKLSVNSTEVGHFFLRIWFSKTHKIWIFSTTYQKPCIKEQGEHVRSRVHLNEAELSTNSCLNSN